MVDSTRLTFQASGSLWQDALVMQDRETKSLWAQVLGEAIKGPMEGKTLTQIPAIHTTFAEFKQLYPNGKLLQKQNKGSHNSHYSGYFEDKTKLGIFGRKDTFDRLEGKDLVYGVRLTNGETAISDKYLRKHGFAVISDVSPHIIVTYDSSSNTAAAFSIENKDKSALSVTENKIILDSLVWNTQTGHTLSGNAHNLEPVPIITAFWFAWASFFPETKLID